MLMSIQTLYAHWNNNKVIIYESLYNVNHIALVFEEVNDKEMVNPKKYSWEIL